MAGQEKRLSPPTPAVNGEHGAKKARAQAVVPVVKQEPRQGVEREEGEVANAAAAVAMAASTEALVALAPGPPALIDVRFEVALLHCKACLLPLKPPVFKCESRHVLCCYSRGGLVRLHVWKVVVDMNTSSRTEVPAPLWLGSRVNTSTSSRENGLRAAEAARA